MRDALVRRYLPLVYVGLVTALLLALVAEQASRGPAAVPGVLVCALAAGFGLEFVWSGWAAKRRSASGERPLPR
jgi:hypothetical protein